jgi:hypothetical protein
MTDLAKLDMNSNNFEYDDVRQLAILKRAAEIMAETTNELVPGPLRGKPGAIMTAILLARDLGLVGTSTDPLRGLAVALTQIHVIEGKPSLSAQLIRGLILRGGHKIDYVQMDTEACILVGTRRDGATLEVRWTMADAERADLSTVQERTGKTKDNWRKYPRSMLLARATTELARALFADVVLWAGYEPSELGGDLAPSDLIDATSVSEFGKVPE